MATALDAEELIRGIREEVQIFGIEPVVDGFPDDEDNGRIDATRLLPCLNSAIQEMREKFYTQCYFTKVLTAGKMDYRLPETDYTEGGIEYAGFPIGFIEEAFLLHPDTDRLYPLEVTTNASENVAVPRRHNRNNRRPFALWVQSDRFGFDAPPDVAYTLRMLVDTLPPDLVNRGDKPQRLPFMLHRGLITGGAYYAGRKALAMPAGQTQMDGRFMRFKEIREEWKTRWLPLAAELANSRFIHAALPVLSVGINDGRR